MFGRKFRLAYAFNASHERRGGKIWGLWTGHAPRFSGNPGFHIFMMRRGRGPFGGPMGPGGPFFHGERGGGRVFGRGDVKFALLELLQGRPMHGYEMMKELEEKSGGFYTPSPGSIYPTLQMLEDRGFVTSQEIEGKRVYHITDEGRQMLTERPEEKRAFAGPPWMRGRPPREPQPELEALRGEAMELVRLFALAGRRAFGHPEQVAHLRSIIERARTELVQMIDNTSTDDKTHYPDRSAPSDQDVSE